jgi:alpha-beta hydrolase superfamily lysophospholipase
MNKTEFELRTSDNFILIGDRYETQSESRRALLIVHGMAEHCARYSDFAEFLTQSQIAVYTYDQRGHGRTSKRNGTRGFFADQKGWNRVAEDVHEVVLKIKTDHPNVPLYVLGHSMGSFISRSYAEKYSHEISGLILSGTAGSAGFLGKAGILLTSFIRLYKNSKSPSKLLDKMSFGDFNKPFKPNRTAFDWLSRDEKQVDKYVADPDCGEIFSIGFFSDLIRGLESVNTSSHATKFRKDLPIHFFSGAKDPVSKNAAHIPHVIQMYRNAGIQNISYKIYEEARHETLNEINRREVFSDVLKILDELFAGNSKK